MPEHPLSTVMKIDPALMDHIKRMDDMVYGEGALPRKVKLLIAMSFDAAHGAPNGVRFLAQSAMNAGATKDEIAEALRWPATSRESAAPTRRRRDSRNCFPDLPADQLSDLFRGQLKDRCPVAGQHDVEGKP